jgi:hypothetical protein
MCLTKTPKIVSPSTTAANDKPLPVLRNPFLDGIDPLIAARRTGTSGLRIDRGPRRNPPGSGRISRTTPNPPTFTGGTVSPTPGSSGSSGSGGGRTTVSPRMEY